MILKLDLFGHEIFRLELGDGDDDNVALDYTSSPVGFEPPTGNPIREPYRDLEP